MKQTISRKTAGLRMAGLLLAGMLLAAPASAEDIYKWVDDENRTQYTQMPPPPGITAIRIQSSPRPLEDETEEPQADDEAEVETDDLAAEDTEDTGDEFTDAGGDEPAGSERDAGVARAMQENCNNARKNLQTLSRGQVRYVSPDGQIIRLSEEERQQRMDEAREQIRVLCKS